MLSSLLYLSFFFFLSLFQIPVHARSQNISIDDQYGDPVNGQKITYTPNNSWFVGQSCDDDCVANPSPSQSAFMATWMEGISNSSSSDSDQTVSALVPFSGTAVYVYCILSGSAASQNWSTDLTFLIDNATVGEYQQSPSNNSSTDNFGQLVFSKTGLSNAQHTLVIQSGLHNSKSLLLLDQIVYTQDESGTTSGSSHKLGPLIGGLVGGAAAFTLFTAVAFIWYRRRQRTQEKQQVDQESYLKRSNSDGYDFRDSTRVFPADLYSPQKPEPAAVSKTSRMSKRFNIPSISRPRLSFSPYSYSSQPTITTTNFNSNSNNNGNIININDNNDNNSINIATIYAAPTPSFASNLLVTPGAKNTNINRCSASVISEAPLSVSARLFRGVSVIEPQEIRDDPYVYIVKDDTASTIASGTAYSYNEKF